MRTRITIKGFPNYKIDSSGIVWSKKSQRLPFQRSKVEGLIMDEDLRMVEFWRYCETCEYKELDENKEPCEECLDHPWNEYTSKPINWKEKETR